jgi:trehalose 6-phosphate phosphatase
LSEPLKALPSPGEWLPQLVSEAGSLEALQLAFDFDGTLAEIAPTPESVSVPDILKESLARAARRYPVAICSGRSVAGIESVLGRIAGLDLIGNHGAERMSWQRGEARHELSMPETWRAWREAKLPEVIARTDEVGGRVEDKLGSIALHYRESGAGFWQSPEGRSFLEARITPGVQLLEGKMAWNLMPEGVNKGEALSRYCRERGKRVLVYFGDEPTDETVFALPSAPDLRVHGVRVGQGATRARYRAASVLEVREWLSRIG